MEIDSKQTNDKKVRKSRVYTTELINSLKEDLAMGIEIDSTPFYPYDNELRASNVTFKMSPEEYEEYIKCFNDAEYFIENYCKFLTDRGRVTVKLRDYQKTIVKAVTSQHYDEGIEEFVPDNRNTIMMCARQCGKTTTTAAYITWYICFHNDRNVGIMANKQDTAIEIVDKTQQMIKGLPYFLKPGVQSWGKKGAKFDNGCAIISSATTKSASIGFTMNGILYLDEFAHIESGICYDFWRSVYPTLASSKTAQLIISSTPNGTENNKFYDIWSGQDNGFHKIRVDYWQVPGHDEAWAAEQKKTFGEEEFNQEFLLQFSSSSRALLRGRDLDFIGSVCERCGDYVPKNLPYGKYLDDERITWCPKFNPNDINPNDRFVFVMDLAEGSGDDDRLKKGKDKSPDSNTIQIFKLVMNSPTNIYKYRDDGTSIADAYRYIQVGKYESNEKDERYCGNIAAALAFDLFQADKYDNVRIMLEMNFNGKSCLDAIMNHPSYFDGVVLSTYHSKPIPGEKAKKKPGFKTSSQTKEVYCKRGERMIRKRRIIITDMQTYNQLKSFGYDKGTIKGIAVHDDLSYPAINHIPRMLDEDYYIDWITEAFENEENTERKFEVNKLIEQYEMEAPDYSDSEYHMFGYGNEMQTTMNPYINRQENRYNSIGSMLNRY